MSELRRDRVTGDWTIIAPERGHRPHRERRAHDGVVQVPAFDPSCPFCPGNESSLPGIISETRSAGVPGWSARVVPNKYPVLTPEDAGKSTSSIVPGFGYHEVIIETHRHDGDLAALALGEATDVVRTYVGRYLELKSRPGVSSVVVFRNHGRRAGASLVHPHSQIIAMGQPSPRLAATTSWARDVYSDTGRCPTCMEVEAELSQQLRVVEVTTSFVLLVPFAAASPYELCIAPRRHAASFGQIDDAEIVQLAALLQQSLGRLNGVLGRPEYRFAIESGGDDKRHAAYNHWRLRIVPQVTIEGGFELGSGLPINPSCPEDDACALREVLNKEGA
ncbi:MAG: DUF4931 domain-containing protein [Alphaproteobacteria bacterium]|nr:DUF4931 domain-containing protein [Alphaproteobacteria bacterium]